MKKILFIITMLSCLLVQADEIKRDSIIQTLIIKELGPNLTWQTNKSILNDSINESPIDSVCLHQAVHIFNGMQNFIHNFASLVVLFPKGTTSFEPKNLPSYKYDKYEHHLTEMKKWFVQQNKLVNLVDNYIPYKYRKVTEHYSVLKTNGDTIKYYGVYFFDEQDNLEKYFWFDEPKWNMTMGSIVYAINHDYSFLDNILNSLGFQFNESFISYLIGNEDTKLNKDELNQVLTLKEVQARKESQSSNNSSQQDYSSTRDSIVTKQETPAQHTSQTIRGEGTEYIVVKDVCGATYSKEAMKEFTEYAINNNITSIGQMIASKQLTLLRKGQIVTMLDFGIFISKVQLADGSIVYTDTEYLQKQ